jgi:hypothetical protein
MFGENMLPKVDPQFCFLRCLRPYGRRRLPSSQLIINFLSQSWSAKLRPTFEDQDLSNKLVIQSVDPIKVANQLRPDENRRLF